MDQWRWCQREPQLLKVYVGGKVSYHDPVTDLFRYQFQISRICAQQMSIQWPKFGCMRRHPVHAIQPEIVSSVLVRRLAHSAPAGHCSL